MTAGVIVLGGAALLFLVVLYAFLAMCFRVVVSTNDVDIVQSAKKTVSYGKGETAGNTYYKWPAWVPGIGVRVTHLPVSVFAIKLNNYAAYDKGRVPFLIDIMAFFRITDSNMAAQRVNNTEDLQQQLEGILQGVCRTILATSEIQEILEGRSQFGKLFTAEVDENLKQWGVQSVKQIELMDIRDAQGSTVIANIMAMKKSLIEKESRVAVAVNMQAAQVAEVEANQAVRTREQEALEQIGVRTAEKEQRIGVATQVAAQEVGVATQQANQRIKEEERNTMEKTMAITQVQTVRQAEITKAAAVVAAGQKKEVAVVEAEGVKQQAILWAEGDLQKQTLNAQGVTLEGAAKGSAEQALLMAPVNAQLSLAKEIGSNKEYQTYLINIRTVEKDEVIGKAQAEALKAAGIKVIANTGNVVSGVQKVMDLFSSQGGTQLGAMVEAFANTPTGEKALKAIGVNPNGAAG